MLDEMSGQCDVALAELRRLEQQLPQKVRAVTANLPNPTTVSCLALAGSGDSKTAAEQVRRWHRASTTMLPMSPQELGAMSLPGDSLVVAISASGGNPPLVDAVQRCRERGLRTVAVTCRADSPLAGSAQDRLIVPIRTQGPSPAVLTYLSCVIALDRLVRALPSLPTGPPPRLPVESETEAAAQLVEILRGESEIRFVAPYDDEPVAAFVAAKVVEVTGRPVSVYPADEWVHVHRFATPLDLPLVVVGLHGSFAAVAERIVRHGFRNAVLLADTGRLDPWGNGAPRASMRTVHVPCGGAPGVVGALLGARLAIALGRLSHSLPFSEASRLPFDGSSHPR